MEEELCYSTVTFKAFDEEKASAPESLFTGAAHDSLSEGKVANSSIAPGNRRVVGILGLLAFLLLAALVAASAFGYIYMSKYKGALAQYVTERDANLQLMADKQELERDKAWRTRLTEEMNSTLQEILNRSSFLGQEYCQNSDGAFQCTPCPQNWIQNGSRCYFFYSANDGWKTWEESEESCKRYGAHLATVENAEEQILDFSTVHLFQKLCSVNGQQKPTAGLDVSTLLDEE
ncbi:hypothetical protein DNTS_016049 [Danionella cerebrum]|uniref:C-type lectin domain-containing protein n=1 Tax=Danionella cerebrum TaxID=2873325 RepID=A0A553QHP2_9TELE|nr:hypothetical protein DNTS_016049 [Danionella translucida]TRY89453.1 hypothetical protein DNTS_016049 [Danionella translucida]